MGAATAASQVVRSYTPEETWTQGSPSRRNSFFSLRLGHTTSGNSGNAGKRASFRKSLRFKGSDQVASSEPDVADPVPQWVPEDWKPPPQLSLLDTLRLQAQKEGPDNWKPYEASADGCVLQHPRPFKPWAKSEREKWQHMGDMAEFPDMI
ncbi:hypothetical protein BROUX41_002246 [Berkeleyomyces rouxiae]|uniref:uncharacterized protein n=1 Tax=Berkeleyomyces rouxiae TaxID=2035830 RepID=UPI003B81BF01